MSRTKRDVAHSSALNADASSAAEKNNSYLPGAGGTTSWTARAAFVAAVAALSWAWQPFGLGSLASAGVGFAAAIILILAELRLRRMDAAHLAGGAAGLVLGTFTAVLVCLVISRTAEPEPTKSFLQFAALLGLAYLGVFLGARKGFPLAATPEFRNTGDPAEWKGSAGKLLDTSVLIDGRIADICEAQFLDGPLLVPQFVLHELQQIADSSDTLRRQRGRRGLEVIQRIQKMPHMQVSVMDGDNADDSDVDRKLVELARKTGAKIVTNDFNLNKVASVQGIAVLNVNQLANALRPAVLPGETMRVFVQREGKEASQGVAYLEDGTMVVVDGARRFLNKNVEITVTSVHQTPAGKMIFGRLLDERAEGAAPLARQAAAGSSESPGRVPDSSPPGSALKRESLDPKKGYD
jgi:uncharacterized protein YacL